MSYRPLEEGATCVACGADFWRKPGEHWKTLCLDCWKVSPRARQRNTAGQAAGTLEQMAAELEAVKRENGKLKLRLLALQLDQQPAAGGIPADMLGRLIRLCHPDRHGNSEAANQATAWLLERRREARA